MKQLEVTPLIDELSENLAEHIDDESFQGRHPLSRAPSHRHYEHTIRLLIAQNFLGEEAVEGLIDHLMIAPQIDAAVRSESSIAN
jgi:hypothetical protein